MVEPLSDRDAATAEPAQDEAGGASRPDDITTPWFDAAQKPAHEGVYQRRYPGGPYACWDGTRWYADSPNAARAAAVKTPSPRQDLPWRGLVHPSAAPCLACRGHGVIDLGVDEESGDDLIEACENC